MVGVIGRYRSIDINTADRKNRPWVLVAEEFLHGFCRSNSGKCLFGYVDTRCFIYVDYPGVEKITAIEVSLFLITGYTGKYLF